LSSSGRLFSCDQSNAGLIEPENRERKDKWQP
jgi:hypothetical protein